MIADEAVLESLIICSSLPRWSSSSYEAVMVAGGAYRRVAMSPRVAYSRVPLSLRVAYRRVPMSGTGTYVGLGAPLHSALYRVRGAIRRAGHR